MTLPLPTIRQSERLPAADSIYYAISSVDRWGRLGARSVLGFLDWDEERAVSFTVGPITSSFWIRPEAGSSTVVRHGELRLPSYVRQGYGIGTNDRLLLRANRSSHTILVMTLDLVEQLMRLRLWGDGDDEAR